MEEAWLPVAEAELTALAAEAEKVDRMPDTLLLRPPPPAGVDLITPDPRYFAAFPDGFRHNAWQSSCVSVCPLALENVSRLSGD